VSTLLRGRLPVTLEERAQNNLHRHVKRNEMESNFRARNDYDEEAAYENYMNPGLSFQSGPRDSANAN